MGENTKIEWCHHTFNPWVGCTKVSPACDRCYAESWAKRTGHPELWAGARRRTSVANWRLPLKLDHAARLAGERHRVFCASLADVFDNQVPEQWRDDLWDLIAAAPDLDWLLLTKRPQNIGKMLPKRWPWPMPNVWLGTTVENQEEADRRIPHLLAVPAKVHFLSCEPLLGEVDLTRWMPRGLFFNAICEHCGHTGSTEHFDFARGHDDADVVCPKCHRTILANEIGTIDWVIAGGESGSKDSRPMYPHWAFSLQKQCQLAGVPFFFKQWGDWSPANGELLGSVEMRRVGKKNAGRRLGGFEWNELPRAA